MNTNNKFNVGDVVKFQSPIGIYPWEGQTFTVKSEARTSINTLVVYVVNSCGERYCFSGKHLHLISSGFIND